MADTIAAGDLDRLVTIQQLTDEIGSSGFPVETWTTLASAWMSKGDVSGRERLRAEQLSAPFDTRWQMHYRADMDPELVDVPKKRRLVYQGRSYDIVAAVQLNRREGVELLTLASSKVAR
jgi:SPP1 family predicted phage head-tail adaptor